MPQFDLSTLSAPELRRLLDSARARGQAAQSYQILQEMAARRELADRSLRSAPAERRIIEMDLGDPLERRPDPLDLAERLPPLSDPEPPPEPPQPSEPRAQDDLDAIGPLRLAEDPPVRSKVPRAPRPVAIAPPRQVRRTPWLASGLAAGLAAGVGLGWLAADIARAPAPRPALAGAPARLDVVVNADPVAAVLAPASAQVPAPPPMEVVAAPPPPPIVEEPPPAAEEAPLPAEPPVQLAATPPVPTERPEPPRAECAAQPTPADRLICADPELQRLQRDLRQAYAEALQAHQDRTLLRQRQLAWRDARSEVSDPRELARLYEERIRKLTAAAADARRAS